MNVAMTEPEAKLRFAELSLQHPGDPRRCAEIIAYAAGIGDPNTIIRMAMNWPNDEFVISEMQRLLDENGPEHYLPSKFDLARLVWGVADNAKIDTEDRLKAAKQYADLMGFIEKTPSVQVQINRVMQVKDYGSDDDWERKALEQQRKVIEHVK